MKVLDRTPAAISILFGPMAAAVTGSQLWYLFTFLGIIGLFYKPGTDYKSLTNLFRQTGLVKRTGDYEDTPKIIAQKEQDGITETILSLPVGLSVKDFERKTEAISEARNSKISFQYQAGKVKMTEVKRKLKESYDFILIDIKTDLEIPIGYSVFGLETLSFDSSYANLLVGGLTRWGKSVFLRGAICTLICKSDTKLILIDLKYGVEFSTFKNCSNVTGYATDEEQARKALKKVEKEMNNRYREFQSEGVVNIQEYNQKTGRYMERQMVIVDEYANLTEYPDIQETMDKIIRMCGGAGIHCIVCTQRPSADVIKSTIKANIPATVAFRTRNYINSRILLDETGAEEIETRGRAIFQTDGNVEVQVMLLSNDQAKELIKPFISQKRELPKKGEIDITPTTKRGVVSSEAYERTRQKNH
jgi:S-DNA-T family DNA segregation ATPase FtsK/SpoIIIE